MKKLILMLVFVSGIFGCICSDVKDKWNIADLELSVSDKDFNNPVAGLIRGDSINLEIRFVPEFVDGNSFNSNPFINSLNATSCDDDGKKGMKDGISNFNVTSDSLFNSFQAQESLNSIIRVSGVTPIDDWLSDSDEWIFLRNETALLTITEKPTSTFVGNFIVTIEFDSGNVVEVKSEEIKWE